MKPTLRTALAVICVGVITLGVVLIVGRVAKRARVADLTENRLYTLSAGTKRLLAKLNQPITLRLYYSRVAARKGPEQIRFWNNYYLYVRDLLEEYVSRSKGKLRLETIDPRPYSEAEEQAIRYGVRRFQLSEDESFFFGLAATTELGKDKVIEFFEPSRQEFVEYDISKIIGALMQREKRKIGVIASVPVMGTDMSPYMMQMLQMQGKRPEGPWTIVENLRESYDVDTVKLEDNAAEIPKDIDYLMVVHPKNLGEKTLFAIDQHVMKGGKLIVFVDPHCLADQPPQGQNQYMMMSHKSSSNLNALLEKWGVKMDPERIAVDRTLAISTALRRDRDPVKLPAYLNLDDSTMNHDEVITGALHSVRMLYPGALTKVDGAGTTVEPLIQTSNVGTTWKPSSPFELQMPDPDAINNAIVDGTEPLMLACLITGKFKTNFPDGIEVDAPKADDTKKNDDGVDAMEPEKEKPAKEEPPTKEEKPAKKTEPAKKEDAKSEAPKKDEKAPEKAKEGAKGEPGEKGKAAPEPKEPAEPKKADEPEKPAEKKPEEAKQPEPAKEPAEKGKPEEAKEPEPPKAEPARKQRIEAVTEAADGAMVVVIADVDVITDMLAYQRAFFGTAQVGDNAPLLLNAIDYLGGAEDLIRVRTRGSYSRPFKVVQEIEREADKATAAQVKEINGKIATYETKLRELGGAATEENIKLIQSDALAKRRTIQAEIRAANKELRRLQARRRESVEALGSSLQTWNMLAAPSIILAIAIVLALVRWVRAKRHAARRA